MRTFYLNMAYGVEAASETYFNTSAKDLKPLAGFIPGRIAPGAVHL